MISEVVIARMLMPRAASAWKAVGRDAGMAAHADADDRDLGDVGRALDRLIADRCSRASSSTFCARSKSAIGTVKVMSVSRAVLGDVLDDHVDIDVGLGERHEHRRGDARLVGDPAQRDLGLVLGIGDAGDDLLFHDLVLVADEGSGRAVGARESRIASGSSKLERTKVRTPWTMASSTERTCSTLAPSEAISSISS